MKRFKDLIELTEMFPGMVVNIGQTNIEGFSFRIGFASAFFDKWGGVIHWKDGKAESIQYGEWDFWFFNSVKFESSDRGLRYGLYDKPNDQWLWIYKR